jgi:predicted small lipoprotein YifL
MNLTVIKQTASLLVLLACVGMSGCGQRGALYLPQPTAKPQSLPAKSDTGVHNAPANDSKPLNPAY